MARKKNPQQEANAATKQGRVIADGQAQARANYNMLAGDHKDKVEDWKNAQQALEVRQSDLVKVHASVPFDREVAFTISREAAKAVAAERQALKVKQDAAKALNDAWATVQQFRNESPVLRLIPDEEPVSEDEAKDDE